MAVCPQSKSLWYWLYTIRMLKWQSIPRTNHPAVHSQSTNISVTRKHIHCLTCNVCQCCCCGSQRKPSECNMWGVSVYISAANCWPFFSFMCTCWQKMKKSIPCCDLYISSNYVKWQNPSEVAMVIISKSSSQEICYLSCAHYILTQNVEPHIYNLWLW